MCLAIPTRIERIEGDRGTCALAGSRTDVVLSLVPEAKIGDWVLVHAGMAIAVVDEQEARETFALLKELDALDDAPAG